MTTPEIPSGKRKELENYDEDNSKKSKIECSDDNTLVDSPGQEDTAENHFTDETLAEKISGEAKEVDDVQVKWTYNNKISEVARSSLFNYPDRISL